MASSFRDLCYVNTAPENDEALVGWDLVRADHKKPTSYYVISGEPLSVRTHWWGGRTVPCVRSGCDACNKHQLSRWTGYLAAQRASDQRRCIVEYPVSAAAAVAEATRTFQSLRGVGIIVSRVAPKVNAKVRIVIARQEQCPFALTDPPDIFDVLCKIWKLDAKANPQYSEFADYALTEEERLAAGKTPGKHVDDHEWMNGRVKNGVKRAKMTEDKDKAA
jgi:hypothetical protein